MNILVNKLAALLLLIALASPAQAAPQCGPVPLAVRSLMLKYGEVVVDTETRPAPGHPEIDLVYEVWHSDATGTWSFTVRGEAVMCLVAYGGDYAGQTVQDFLDAAAAEKEDEQGTAL